MQEQETAGHYQIAIGEAQNFTSIKLRTFDRNLAEELSYNDDPKIQAQIANHGHNVYYSDNTADGILKLVARPIPAGFHSDWDRLLVSDGSAPGVRINYVSMVGDKDYFADIVDNETSLHYKDSAIDITLYPHAPPPNVSPDFDRLFLTADDRYGMLNSTSKGMYRLYFQDAATKQLRIFDFRPIVFGLNRPRRAGTAASYTTRGASSGSSMNFYPLRS